MSGYCDGLFYCAGPDSYCGFDCFYEICDTGVGYLFYKDCTDCIGTYCCAEFHACMADNPCMNCMLNGWQGQSCQQTTLDDDAQNCEAVNCTQECGYYY
ncbi:MAG: hypothetical protein JRI23_02490 [Deltaproteobacteria bacterium]|nr:hypothetical protein [Deltaproteobacteria bacterium]MBW2530363.1 hypothetical protein [Deltaproteobacteria bacterium]